jgi:hypothetical protein
MSDVLHDLISIKKKLQTHERREPEEVLKYMQRLSNIEITKKSIRDSKINEIIRIMSKNSGNAFDPRIVQSAKRIREAWKQHFKKGKAKVHEVPPKELEENKKKMEDTSGNNQKVNKSSKIKPESPRDLEASKVQKHNFVVNEEMQLNIDVEDDGTIYNNEYQKYYQEIDNKKRAKCFKMLVKIFESLIDVIARVYRDRVTLKQPPFSETMGFIFSDFFSRIHKEHLLLKNKT